MSDGNDPTMTPHQHKFFSEWYVDVVWPNGHKKRVDGFRTEAHARGWIEHESREWINEMKGPNG